MGNFDYFLFVGVGHKNCFKEATKKMLNVCNLVENTVMKWETG